jgi:hypothetical protein
MPLLKFRRRPVSEPRPDADTPATPAAVPLNWPTAAVVIALVTLAAVLFGLGHPAGAVIGLLTAAAAVAVAVVRQIGGRS